VAYCGTWFGLPASAQLAATIEAFVNQSPRVWFADELSDALHVEVQDPLCNLVLAGGLRRSAVPGVPVANANGLKNISDIEPGWRTARKLSEDHALHAL
jgi:hypothetical protein